MTSHRNPSLPSRHLLLSLLAALSLTACGGWMDDEKSDSGTASADSTTSASGSTTSTSTTTTGSTSTTAAASTGTSGKLTLSVSAPSAHYGDIDTATAKVTNEERPAGSAFAFTYCALKWEDATSSNGSKYALQVDVRQSDAKVVNFNVGDTSFVWVVGQTSATGDITGVTVNPTTRTVTYTAKVTDSHGDTTKASTLTGTPNFPAHATTAACGAGA